MADIIALSLPLQSNQPLNGLHWCTGSHHAGHPRNPASLSFSRGSSPQARVWSFPIVHFYPPFGVELHGFRVHFIIGAPELFLEGSIEPFHRLRDVGDLGGRTKSLIPYSCEDPQTPRSMHSLQYLLVWAERGTFRSSSRDTLGRFRGLSMEGGIGPPQDEVFCENSLYTLPGRG